MGVMDGGRRDLELVPLAGEGGDMGGDVERGVGMMDELQEGMGSGGGGGGGGGGGAAASQGMPPVAVSGGVTIS